jgi:sugar-specific transcriptional regulator TrmB
VTVDDESAVEGLQRLGLTSYEAEVFLALQKLGTATASEVAAVTDVPRSQVYGAAERLEGRDLVETRQSQPTAYRSVSLERARTTLLEELQSTGANTFEYLEAVGEHRDGEEQTEAIWLVEGEAGVGSRIVELVDEAEEAILFGTDETSLLAGEIITALESAADEGIAVVVGSNNAEVRAVAEDAAGVEAYRVPDDRSPDVNIGRLLVVDDRTILLSVFSSPEVAGEHEEVAFWSADSTFAAVLVEFIQDWFLEPFD